MRIISGEFKGRRLEAPRGTERTRPLPDRVRTAIFNMLKGHFEGEAFMDVFAGTGSFGLEAISRGAARCVCVERDREVVKVLKRNIESLGAGDRLEVHHGDALGMATISRCPSPVHVINFDPPYPMMVDPDQRRRVLDQFVRVAERLDPTGFAILRTPEPFYEPPPEDAPDQKTPVDLTLPGLEGPETHVYGSTAVHWYMRSSS